MSALDRAFIKAYAKDLPAAASGEAGPPLAVERTQTATTVAGTRRSAAPSTVASAIEQIYHEGSLYRIETPVPATPRRASVPAPHFRLPPRTSPKRNVRRSILRLAGQEQQALTPMPVEPPPAARVAACRGTSPCSARWGRFRQHLARQSPIPTLRRSAFRRSK